MMKQIRSCSKCHLIGHFPYECKNDTKQIQNLQNKAVCAKLEAEIAKSKAEIAKSKADTVESELRKRTAEDKLVQMNQKNKTSTIMGLNPRQDPATTHALYYSQKEQRRTYMYVVRL
jgi:hypothetical protein